MIRRVAWGVQRLHSGEACAVVQLDVGIERLDARCCGTRPLARLSPPATPDRADMIVVGVADQDERDLTAGMAQDRLYMFGMVFRSGIEHHQPLRRVDQIGVGAEIGHRTRVVRDDPADPRAAPANWHRAPVPVRSEKACLSVSKQGQHACRKPAALATPADRVQSGGNCRNGRRWSCPKVCCSWRSTSRPRMRMSSTTGTTASISRSVCAFPASSTPSAGSTKHNPDGPRGDL